MKIKILTAALLILLFFNACKDNNNSVVPEPIISKPAGLVIAACEGTFGNNDASLSVYEKDSNRVTKDIYYNVNGASLGQTANSMVLKDNKLLIAVDGSNKVEIVDAATFKSLGSVDLGPKGSPRELFYKDSTVCFVTSAQMHQVVKFNPSTRQVIKRIACGDFPEGIAESNNRLFVANQSYYTDANTVSVIDITSDTKIKTITVGLNPRLILKGKDNYIYVICTGQYEWQDTSGRGGIYRIDPVSMSVADSLIIYKNPGEACFVGSYIYVVNKNGVLKVDYANHSVSSKPIIEGTKINSINGTVFSLYYDETSQILYCGNCKNYSQDGEVAAFSADGQEKFRFSTGPNPGTILVK